MKYFRVNFSIESFISFDYRTEIFLINHTGSPVTWKVTRGFLCEADDCYGIYDLIMDVEADMTKRFKVRPKDFSIKLSKYQIDQLEAICHECFDQYSSVKGNNIMEKNKTPIDELDENSRIELMASMLAFLNKEVPKALKNPKFWEV